MNRARSWQLELTAEKLVESTEQEVPRRVFHGCVRTKDNISERRQLAPVADNCCFIGVKGLREAAH